MPDDQPISHPVAAAELEAMLSLATPHTGRRRVRSAGDVTARVTAERPAQHLKQPGCVPMRHSSATPFITRHKHPHGD